MANPALTAVVGFLNDNQYVRHAKNYRNRLIDTYFRSRGVDAGRILADELRSVAGDGLCVTVAFNTPWVIDILTAAWQRYATGMTLVVADNSSDVKAREAVKRICEARSISYVALPRNPEWSPNRSHGIAMNWTYYNLLRYVRPKIFGYIDHDCFPIAPIDIPARMAGYAVYGRRSQLQRPDAAWHLWAGLCFFRSSAVEGIELDFKHRIEFGLDTGGGNWPALYGRLCPEDILAVEEARLELHLGEVDTHQEIFDGSLWHLDGASYKGKFSQADYRKLLSDYIWEHYLGGQSERILKP